VGLAVVSFLAPLISMLAPANWINMTLSARDVGGPGMIMNRNTSADAMRDMAAVDPRLVSASYDLGVQGDQELPFEREGIVKVFDLHTTLMRTMVKFPDRASTSVRATGSASISSTAYRRRRRYTGMA
jgi:manganese oxidase